MVSKYNMCTYWICLLKSLYPPHEEILLLKFQINKKKNIYRPAIFFLLLSMTKIVPGFQTLSPQLRLNNISYVPIAEIKLFRQVRFRTVSRNHLYMVDELSLPFLTEFWVGNTWNDSEISDFTILFARTPYTLREWVQCI